MCKCGQPLRCKHLTASSRRCPGFSHGWSAWPPLAGEILARETLFAGYRCALRSTTKNQPSMSVHEWDVLDASRTSRTIPKRRGPRRACTCTCRADADDTMPGNIKPALKPFAFGTASASHCDTATKDAKRKATKLLGMKPKHIRCECEKR